MCIDGRTGAGEECVLGWEELELEVIRDKDLQSYRLLYRNVDPMGVHTGDFAWSIITAGRLKELRTMHTE